MSVSNDSTTISAGPEITGRLDDLRVQAIMRYQQQVAAGDFETARQIFWPDVTYVVPGRGLLAGTYRGPATIPR